MSYSVYRSILTLIWLIVAMLLLISLISYSVNDPSWTHLGSHTNHISNLAGISGAWLADFLYTFFGISSWWLVIMACFEGRQIWLEMGRPHGLFRAIGYLVILALTAICLGLIGLLNNDLMLGGVVGQVVALTLNQLLPTILAIVVVTILLALVLAYVFNVQQLFGFNRRRQKAIEADAQAIYEYLQANSTSTEMATLTLSGLAMDRAISEQQTSVNETSHNQTQNNQQNSVLSEFLQETGFNDERNDEWEANYKSQNAFKPVGSSFLQNNKLTEKLDAKLHEEVIGEPKGFDKPQPIKDDKKSTMWQSHDSTVFQPLQPSLLTNHGFEQTLPPADVIEDNEQILVEQNEAIDDVVDTETFVEQPTLIEQTEQENDIFADLSQSVQQINTYHETPEIATEPMVIAKNYHDEISIKQPVVDIESTNDDYKPIHNEPTEDEYSTSMHQQVVETVSIEPKITNNPLDIHNDTLFANKSRAMQTAKHRASLTPIPELSLLDLPEANRKPSYTKEQLQQLSELLEIKLQEFNVKATVVNAEMGPVVTRFEVELAPGVKASKVTGISRDLARSLSMASVRVVEVIPGKPYIGIEIPNKNRQMVRLIELLQTPEFQDPEGLLSMAMGKDIAGRTVITDLAKAPHMLVAGTTGSGKSVLVNSLLLSLLLKYTPDNLRLILIDPKQLELANYNDIPHLLTPVVTDMTEATSGLAWCVAEMERRYQLMSLFKVRKLAEFNKKVAEAEQNGLPLLDPLWRITDSVSQDKPPKLKPLPQIVIVADEFADMIMQIGKPAEELITRLAQKSRAAGIHLILATQRPSVDVITGLIKANIPVRSALRVNSKIDSRTILDSGGAEDMLGHGDMLFLGPGQNEPVRVHGAFISDAEVNRICDAWRERGAPDYVENMFDSFDVSSGGQQQTESTGGTFGDDDPLYDEVVAFVMETRKVSASSIQRKFSIGYNRAARIVDAMEQAGLVSAMGKNGKRELLM